MPFTRMFDEEVDRAAVEGCLNDGVIKDAMTYGMALTTTQADLTGVEPGIYQVFLAGMDPAASVLIKVGREAADGLTTPTATPQRLSMFPGSVTVRIRVLPGLKVVSARLIAGSGTLYLSPVVAL